MRGHQTVRNRQSRHQRQAQPGQGVPACLANVTTIGIKSTRPTVKNTGIPTSSAISTTTNACRPWPQHRAMVPAIVSAPPETANIFPNTAPSAMTKAIEPRISPTPF